jgi:hypothetical protein
MAYPTGSIEPEPARGMARKTHTGVLVMSLGNIVTRYLCSLWRNPPLNSYVAISMIVAAITFAVARIMILGLHSS